MRAHPSVALAELVIALVNAAQEVMFRDFPDSVIRARLERLWQPSAYVGTYGELASPHIAKSLEAWHREQDI